MSKTSHATIEELLLQIEKIDPELTHTFEIWVPTHLTLQGLPVRPDAAMAIILDKILGKGCQPDGVAEAIGGRFYKYKLLK